MLRTPGNLSRTQAVTSLAPRPQLLVIEHNLDVVRHADWIIDLGPEGGSGGGRIVFEGTPSQMQKSGRTHTAECLRAHSASSLS